jgi:hypothetical protein
MRPSPERIRTKGRRVRFRTQPGFGRNVGKIIVKQLVLA